MEDNKFDKYIHDTLGEFQAEYDPDSWLALSDKLDQQEGIATDEEFDGEVKETVERYTETYNPQTWPVLLKKMEANEYFRASLYGTKISEAIILLLLLITIGRFTPDPEHVQEQGPVQYAENVDLLSPAADQAAVVKDAVQEAGTDPIATSYDAISSVSGYKRDFSQQQSASRLESRAPKSGISETSPAATKTLEKGLPGTFVAAGSRTERTFIAEIPVLHPSAVEFTDAQTLGRIAEPTVLANPDLVGMLAMSSLHRIPQASALWLNKIRKKNTKSLYLSTFAGTDINFIETPFDNLLYTDGYEQTRAGFGGGVTILWGGKTVFLETGFAYSAKNYSPEKFVELLPFHNSTLYRGESLEGIRFNILSIPFNVLYKIDQKGKWHFYATAGTSLNLSVVSSYRKEETIISDQDPLPPKHLITSSRVAQLDKKNYQAGLFEGGEFKDNYFVTLNSGLGMERHLNSDWILFAQSSYQFNFFNTGLGPNQDRISSFSLSLGTRYKLK